MEQRKEGAGDRVTEATAWCERRLVPPREDGEQDL